MNHRSDRFPITDEFDQQWSWKDFIKIDNIVWAASSTDSAITMFRQHFKYNRELFFINYAACQNIIVVVEKQYQEFIFGRLQQCSRSPSAGGIDQHKQPTKDSCFHSSGVHWSVCVLTREAVFLCICLLCCTALRMRDMLFDLPIDSRLQSPSDPRKIPPTKHRNNCVW